MKILLAAALAIPFSAFSQAYPTKPIRILSGTPVGNSGDTVMRMAVPAMTAGLGQPLVIEARPAASGTAAAVAIKTSPPDGYNLLFVSSSTIVNAFLLMKSVSFDSRKDFTPVTEVMNNPSLFVVSAATPVSSVKEFIEYAKKNPGKVAYGSTGIGTSFHLLGEAFAAETGIRMLHVPYTGAMAIPVGDLANDRIQLFWPSLTSISPVIQSGKVKILAVVDKVPLKALPNVPTVYRDVPDSQSLVKGWFGLFGPAGLPMPIATRLQTEFRKAVAPAEVVSKLEGLGIMGGGNTPQEFHAMVMDQIDKVEKIVKSLKLEPQ
jgi:tripartite-type tricarboxylate transporter receptor subunit TctC